MKTLLQIFTDNTPVNGYTELTHGGLVIAIVAVVLFASALTIWIKKEMKTN